MSTQSRLSLRSSTSAAGFTLTEVMVGLTVTMVAFAAALSLALGAKRIFEADRERIASQDTLRGSKELIVNDIRQAGERLATDFPAVEIVNGAGTDELIVRRNMHNTVMRLCRELRNSQRRLHVAENVNPPPPGCIELPDTDGDGLPDNLDEWKAYRQANGGQVKGYVYDPVAGVGEFFDYMAERDNGTLVFLRARPHTWARTYPVANQCRVYLLEERRYRVTSGLLELVIDGDTGFPQVVADEIVDFQLTAVLKTGATQASFGAADTWTELRGIQIALDTTRDTAGGPIVRSWDSEIVPRNVISK